MQNEYPTVAAFLRDCPDTINEQLIRQIMTSDDHDTFRFYIQKTTGMNYDYIRDEESPRSVKVIRLDGFPPQSSQTEIPMPKVDLLGAAIPPQLAAAIAPVALNLLNQVIASYFALVEKSMRPQQAGEHGEGYERGMKDGMELLNMIKAAQGEAPSETEEVEEDWKTMLVRELAPSIIPLAKTLIAQYLLKGKIPEATRHASPIQGSAQPARSSESFRRGDATFPEAHVAGIQEEVELGEH